MNDFKLVDYSDRTVVAYPNMGILVDDYYRSQAPVGGITRFNLQPVVALPYILETDGRAVVDESSMANPGLSSEIPVGNLNDQGHF